MIKHIVFFGIADEVDGKSKAEVMNEIKIALENLIDLVPSLKKIEVGLNHPETPASNFDLSLYTEFEDIDGLNAYQVHPEHLKVAAFIGKAKTSRACVDYEV